MPTLNLPRWRRYLTVEPVVLFYTFGLFMSLPVMTQYIYFRVSEFKGFPYNISATTEKGCVKDSNGNGTSLEELEKEVQTLAARIDMGNILFQSLPSILMVLLLGPWTDTGGRRPALLAPPLGSALEAITVLLIMYFDWPVFVLFVGSAINGFSGFFTIMNMAAFAYVSDITTEEGLAIHIAVVQLVVFIGGVVSQLTSGAWLNRLGFIPPYWFIFACHVAGLLWAAFMVPESKRESQKNKIRFFSLDSFKAVWSVYKKPRNGGRKNLLMLLISDGIITLGVLGISGVVSLFVLRTPLCWGPATLGVFMAFRFFMQGFGGIVGIGILKRFMSEVNVMRVGMVSQCLSLVFFAFSNRTWMVFLVPLIGIFGGAVVPLYKGMMSQMVEPDERGAMFSSVATVDTFCNFLGAFIFNPMYIQSSKFGFRGLPFLVAAVLIIIPMILTKFLKNPMSFRKMTETLAEPEADETEVKLEDIPLDEDEPQATVL
ncbi:proton-coupled folate transporter [Pocillopora verrucosa]|uniref:proton-coupled folate transporter n=1 Tax=Pocillopora verrucosa TaxID=203993 RepID=UPI00333E9439